MSQRIGFLLLLMIYLDLPNDSYAIGNLTSIPETSIPGTLSVCLGVSFSLTCVHDNPNPEFAITFWQLPGVSTCLVTHSVSGDLTCDPFTVTMISGTTGATLSSTVSVTAMDSLSGGVFGCLDGVNPTSPSVGNITLDVLSVPVPSVSVLQVSQSTVQVNTSVNTTQCVGTYQVDVSREDVGSPSMSVSPTPQHTVNDLDLCRYNYSFAASIITAGGESGNVSPSVSFTVDLSVLNGVNNVRVNQEGSLLLWDQQQNVNYATCIISYTVSWNGNEFSTGDTLESATREDLNTAGFPYCQNIPITVTPVTPMGPLTGVSTAVNATLVSPEFVALSIYGFYTLNITNTETTKITTTTEMIVFSGTIQNISDMVVSERSYGCSRSNTMCTPTTTFTDNSFEITLPMDATPGDIYTFCVKFVNNDCMEMAASNFPIPGRNITIEDDEMVLYSSFTFTTNLPITEYRPDQLQINISVTPNDAAPVVADFPASYQYTVMFSGLMTGTSYTYTVRVVRRSDMTDVVDSSVGSFTTATLSTTQLTASPFTTISPATIVGNAGQQTSAYILTLTLPRISYSHSELFIVSTLTPADLAPIINDYPLSSQYSVTFNGLSAGVEYSYSIRIVLRTNTSVDVSIPLMGSFTLLKPFSTRAAIALSVIVTFLLTLVVGVSIGVLIVLAVNKYRRRSGSEKVTLQTETEMRSPPVIYEEPGDIKPDPLTQGNAAYGEIVY